MMLHPVNGSCFEAAGYDLRGREFHARFRDGRSIAYQGVDLRTVRAFFTAKSKGKFYCERIRGVFPQAGGSKTRAASVADQEHKTKPDC